MTPKQLKAARASLGLTQNQLADKLNTSHRNIKNWEQGIHKIPAPVAQLINIWIGSGK